MEKKQWRMGQPSDHDMGLTLVKRGKRVEWQMSLNDVLFEESFSKAGGESLGQSHWPEQSYISQKCTCLFQKRSCYIEPLAGDAIVVVDVRQHDWGPRSVTFHAMGRSERHILMATASYFIDKETDTERLGDIFKIS